MKKMKKIVFRLSKEQEARVNAIQLVLESRNIELSVNDIVVNCLGEMGYKQFLIDYIVHIEVHKVWNIKPNSDCNKLITSIENNRDVIFNECENYYNLFLK